MSVTTSKRYAVSCGVVADENSERIDEYDTGSTANQFGTEQPSLRSV